MPCELDEEINEYLRHREKLSGRKPKVLFVDTTETLSMFPKVEDIPVIVSSVEGELSEDKAKIVAEAFREAFGNDIEDGEDI